MIYKNIILGSGPAGYTAALYTGRANLHPLMIDGGVGRGQELLGAGGQLMITTEVENYPGFVHGIQGPDLMAIMREQALRFDVEVVEDMATKVDFSEAPYRVWVGDCIYEAETVTIATGASAKWLGLPEELPAHQGGLGGRGVSACATCDGFFFKGQHVAVVGGGDTAMEEAIYLTNHCERVTVIHRRDTLRASKIMQERAFRNPRIDFIWDTQVMRINEVQLNTVTGLTLKNLKTDEISNLEVTGVFIAIGHKPNTELFEGILELDELGYIRTHDDVKTNIPGIFACGDVQDTKYRQAITAAGSGCMAAIQAERYLEEKHSGVNTLAEV